MAQQSAAAERAAEARKEADRLSCEAWNKRMLGFQGPAQPSPWAIRLPDKHRCMEVSSRARASGEWGWTSSRHLNVKLVSDLNVARSFVSSAIF